MIRLYRYIDGVYTVATGRYTRPEFVSFEVYSTTDTGVWIPKTPGSLAPWLRESLESGRKKKRDVLRFVSNTAKKRYAYQTEYEARAAYIARKLRQNQICRSKLAESEMLLDAAKDMMQ